MARYCLKRLPPTTSVIAIHNGKVVFNRCSNNQLPGSLSTSNQLSQLRKIIIVICYSTTFQWLLNAIVYYLMETNSIIYFDSASENYILFSLSLKLLHYIWFLSNISAVLVSKKILIAELLRNALKNILFVTSDVKEDPRHSFDETGNSTIEESDSEFNDFELPEIEKPDEKQGDSKGDLKDDKFSPLHEHKKVSPLIDEISEQRHGWPLLRRGNLVAQKLDEARKMSVVQWVMSLPDRSPPETPQANKDSFCLSQAVSVNGFSAWGEVPKELELLLRTNSFELKWFSRDLLESSTSHFSSGSYLHFT